MIITVGQYKQGIEMNAPPLETSPAFPSYIRDYTVPEAEMEKGLASVRAENW
jgi:hypothetical protein